ncbi:MAG: vWA domain-containing protein [Nonlabens sp.]
MTVLWILLAVVIAAFVALYQYGYIFSKNNKRKPLGFALLRFFTVLTILILLLFPKFKSVDYETVLPKLILLVDNSSSIDHLGVSNELSNDFDKLLSESELKKKFNISSIGFGSDVRYLDSLSFSEQASDLGNALEQSQNLFRNEQKAIVILTDGIQNKGRSYEFSEIQNNTKLYPIIYGDTVSYPDLQINQININRYSYLSNEFPVEVIVNYSGKNEVSTIFKVTEKSRTLFSKQLSFDANNNSEIIRFNLKSDAVGLKSMVAQIREIEGEKNTANNYRSLAVEVIDQQTKILIQSNILHPDIGALKKAIKSNDQRTVDIKYGTEIVDYSNYNLVILYGINYGFEDKISELQKLNKNCWIITGKNPVLDEFNNVFEQLSIESDPETDEVQPILNPEFGSFNIEDFDYSDYPPVEAPYGSWNLSLPADIIMYKRISGIDTKEPIWFTFENNASRYAISSFNGFWRWRAAAYLENKSFADFDGLIGAQVQYLADNRTRNRLEVDVPNIIDGNDQILFKASYLDKNYEFDRDAVLNMRILNTENDSSFVRPFVLNGNKYQLDLSGVNAGNYSYIVQVDDSELKKSGLFQIQDYDPEKNIESASKTQFEKLVGKENVYYQNQLDKVILELSNDDIARPLQREEFSFLGLIDYKYILALLGVLLGLEWFFRKYNGLI